MHLYFLTTLSGFFAIIGHLFPVWLKFKGGKGVATTLGTFLALKPLLGILACGIWLLMAVILRYSSLSALIAIGLTPVIAHFLYHNPNLTGFCGIVATLVFYKHRENIKRLLSGQEPKIGQKK
jgi:glycerol-3-phosphate acyltransferase PlsY